MFNTPFILFALTFLSIVGFLNPKGILSPSLIKMLYCFFSMLALAWGIFYGRRLSGVYYPRRLYWAILISILFSTVMASAFHEQSFGVSVMTTLPTIFGYLLFWTMMKLAIPKAQVLKFCLIISFIAVPVYFIDVATFPNFLFGGESLRDEDVSRGILRVPVYFIYIIMMMVFYAINQVILNRRKWFWIFTGSLFAFMVVMSVWRQNIAMTFGLSFIFIFLNTTWLKRILMVVVAVLAVSFVPKIPMFKAMLELSEDQADKNDDDEDIRVYDYRYFGYEFQTNDITRVFGNGSPSFGNSRWGDALETEWYSLGTFPVDTGWVGFYWYYGAIGVLSVLILFVLAAAKKKRPDQQYLTYTFIMYILAEIANAAIMYNHEIPCVIVALYLLYGPDPEEQTGQPSETVNYLPRKKRTLLDYHNVH